MVGHLVLRLTIWLLLTANLSVVNILLGVGIALLLPRGYSSQRFKDWLRVLGKIMIAIPVAYVEAIEMILRPHLQEEVIMERVNPRRSPQLIFLDIFLITFTPKTIVLNYHKAGWYEVHRVQRTLPEKTLSESSGRGNQ